MNPETLLKNSIMNWLKSAYPGIMIMKLADKFSSGYPDLILIHKNWGTCFVELKAKKGRISRIQEYMLNKINQSGGKATVIRSIEELTSWLTFISE